MEQSLFLYFISIGALLILLRFVIVLVIDPVVGLFTRFTNDIRVKMK